MIIDARSPTQGPHSIHIFIASSGDGPVEAEVQANGDGGARPVQTGGAIECEGASLRSIRIAGLAPATAYRVNVRQADSRCGFYTSTLPLMKSAYRFRFGIISDPHCSIRDDIGPGGRLFSYSTTLLETALQRMHDKGLDFVAILGDLVDKGSDDEIAEAKRIIDASPIPCKVLVGNHESRPKEFIKAFGLPECGYYSFDHKGMHFICIYGRTPRDLLPVREQSAWLRTDLARHQDSPTILFSHYCFCEMPDIAREDDHHFVNADEMSTLLLSQPQVKAVFAGHKNIPSLQRNGHVANILCPQLVNYDNAYDVVDVHESGFMRRIYEVERLDLLWRSRTLAGANSQYRFGKAEARNFVHEW